MANYSLIKVLCKEKGVTLKQLAETIGFSEAGLLKIIKEETTKVKTLEDIAKALDIPVSEFFSDDPNINLKFSDDDYNHAKSKIAEAGLEKYQQNILYIIAHLSSGSGLTKDKLITYIISHYDDLSIKDRDIEEQKKSIDFLRRVIDQHEKIIDMLYDNQKSKK